MSGSMYMETGVRDALGEILMGLQQAEWQAERKDTDVLETITNVKQAVMQLLHDPSNLDEEMTEED